MSVRSTAASDSHILFRHGLLAPRVDCSHHPRDGGLARGLSRHGNPPREAGFFCLPGLSLPQEIGMSEFDTTRTGTALSAPAVLHMVCGKIGAGKSTLTQRLATEPKTILISEDDWLARLYPNEIHAI